MRRLIGALIFAGTLDLPGSLHAGMMPHHELAGLVLRSQAIVLAETHGSFGRPPTRFKVQKAYLGPILPGEELKLDVSGYGDPSKSGPTYLLFLTDEEARVSRKAPGRWRIVPSGIKVFSGGKVLGFQQLQNPGGYSLVAEVLEGLSSGDSSQASIRDYDYEGRLRNTIRRTEAYRKAVALADPANSRRSLLLLLGPQRPPPVALSDYTRYKLDEIEGMVVRDLKEVGGMEAALEGLSLLGAASYPRRRENGQFDVSPWDPLLASARDRRLPSRLRAAAVLGLSGFLDRRGMVSEELCRLLADPDAEIRRAVVGSLARSLEHADADLKAPPISAVSEALEAETDPSVKALMKEGLERLYSSSRAR
jgi:hypothetical protein